MVRLQSGLLGGDLEIGAKITEGTTDFVIFLWEPQPHDPDVNALVRVAVVWNVPVACSRASADFVISSPLVSSPHEHLLPDFTLHPRRLEIDSEIRP